VSATGVAPEHIEPPLLELADALEVVVPDVVDPVAPVDPFVALLDLLLLEPELEVAPPDPPAPLSPQPVTHARETTTVRDVMRVVRI
jgi:hypothetical protein